MKNPLLVFNTLTRKKEIFQPLNPPFTGMYVCGPTVYGDAHLGHARPAITFDVVYRYLSHLGYKVRYVRNITDVGHLENDADEGEDKIGKKARIEQIEPMEVVQYYTDRYHLNMDQLNVLHPSIEPRASGHIIEQIEMTKKIIAQGFAYEVNGSIYFDVLKYNQTNRYGKLSGRVPEEQTEGTRILEGQEEKRHKVDFALWKKATPAHIMRWPSPWGEGFPGWHLECSVMSAKYLGDTFDIHGGGMDLLFPHHECEIAQSQACNGKDPARYWLHNNMVTINGQKMGKSLGNFITLDEIFSGKHSLLHKEYSPMTVRFFILQAHYRSTLDFSNEALQAAEKGYKKLVNGIRTLKTIQHAEDASLFDEALNKEIVHDCEACYAGMNDDFNSAVSIAHLFNLLKKINSFKTATINPSALRSENFALLRRTVITFFSDILGLVEEKPSGPEAMDNLIDIILESYKKAKKEKDYAAVDQIRARLKKEGIVVKDAKTGIEWSYEE